MRPSSAQERTGCRPRLTDLRTIIAEVGSLQAEGYSELAIWRYFLESFIIDLDALALIIQKLFAPTQADCEPPLATPAQAFAFRQAA